MRMLTPLQILLDDERYERLARRATENGTSIAMVVRDAIDARFPAVDPEREAADKAILAAEPMPVPLDPADLKREILETRSTWG